MKNPKIHGKPPYRVAVLHGGPGALGETAPMARELARQRGVLEPFQTKNTIEGLLGELKRILEKKARLPVVLIGHSWGAWLGFIFAARHPDLVKKLVLVSSGPFERKYENGVLAERLRRLNAKKRREASALLMELRNAGSFARFAKLMVEADSYDALPADFRDIQMRPGLFRAVWKEAAELRRNGGLLELGRRIRCPVIAVHGDFDPHPAAGVRKPLSGVLKDFRFVLLKRCGHTPWMEKQARANFYKIINRELQ